MMRILRLERKLISSILDLRHRPTCDLRHAVHPINKDLPRARCARLTLIMTTASPARIKKTSVRNEDQRKAACSGVAYRGLGNRSRADCYTVPSDRASEVRRLSMHHRDGHSTVCGVHRHCHVTRSHGRAEDFVLLCCNSSTIDSRSRLRIGRVRHKRKRASKRSRVRSALGRGSSAVGYSYIDCQCAKAQEDKQDQRNDDYRVAFFSCCLV